MSPPWRCRVSDPQEPPEVVDSADDIVLVLHVRRVPTIIDCPVHHAPELKNGWAVDMEVPAKYGMGDADILMEALLGATQRMLLRAHEEGIVFAIEGTVPPDRVRVIVGTVEASAENTTIH